MVAMTMSHLVNGQENADGDKPGLEVMIVTAQKRAQNLQDVPIAIQSFNNESLQSKGISSVTDLAPSLPNVELDYTSAFSGSTQVLGAFIRGIGQADFAFNLEPGVGVYIDGVFYARAIGSVVDLLDVDNIEVLKGPQGTLFGRNTIGGALNITTRKPSDTFQHMGEITIGEYNRKDLRGVVDIPLSDSLFSQLSFSSKNRDGYHRRIPFPGTFTTDVGRFIGTGEETFNDTQGGENNHTLRGKLLWDNGGDISVLFSVDSSNTDEASAPNTLIGTFPDAPDPNNGLLGFLYNACISAPAGAVAPFCDSNRAVVGTALGGVNLDGTNTNDRLLYNDQFITDDIDTTYGRGANYSKLSSWGTSATLDWSLSNDVDFKSITAYRELDSSFGSDVDGSPLVINDTSFAIRQQQWSQELQLTGLSFDGKMEWVGGFYYFHEQGDSTDNVVFGEGLVQIVGPNDFTNDAYALFGQLNYSFTDKFSSTVGVRYTYEDKVFTGGQRDLNAFASQSGAVAPEDHPDPSDLTLYFPTDENNRTFDNVSAKLGFEYRFTPDILSYVSFSQGFKSGGWTTRATVAITEAPEFEEETADTYEVGLKSQWFDNTLRLNMALFSTDYDDLQITVQRGLSPFIENAGKSKIEGLEADFVWVATDALTLSGAIGLIDARYTELEAGAQVQEDFLFNNTPEESASLSVDYVMSMQSGSSWQWHVDYAYTSEQANDAENTPELIADSQSTFNGSLTFRPSNENWEVALGAKNITDERYIVSGFRQVGAGVIDGTYSRPREWYLTFRYFNQ